MKKIILTALALGGLAGGVGFSNSQTPMSAQASTAYTWGKAKSYPNPQPFYYAGKSSVYLWSKYHTTKLYNLKNYPKTTWYLSKSVQMKHNGKSAIYYAVTSGNGKTKGYVWRGYLTKGVNPNNTASVINSLTTKVSNLFPGILQDPSLQSFAEQDKDYYANTNDGTADYSALLKKQFGNQAIMSEFSIPKSDLQKNNQNLTQNIQTDLQKQGYTFNDFSGWYIGIYVHIDTNNSNNYAGTILLAPK